MKIVVTGASSFIGKNFIIKALKSGAEVIGVVRENCNKIEDLKEMINFSYIECDMKDYALLGEKIGKCDCFVHLAWNGTRGNLRNNYIIQKENYDYSMLAIKSIIDTSECKRIILAGSQAEYGAYNSIITEEMESRPNTEYGKFKLKLYNDVLEICNKKNIEIKEPRFFSLYGESDFDGTLIMTLVKNMVENKPCELTECIQMWDFCYIDDAINAVLDLCLKNCSNGIYNIASGNIKILKEYIENIRDILNSKSELFYGKVPYPVTGVVSIQPSIQKIKNETGWYPKVSFEEGINRIKNSLKKSNEE